MRALKVIGNCCLVFLAIISVCVSLAYLYVHFFDNNITTGTNYIDNQTPVDLVEKEEDLTQDQIDYYEDRLDFDKLLKDVLEIKKQADADKYKAIQEADADAYEKQKDHDYQDHRILCVVGKSANLIPHHWS